MVFWHFAGRRQNKRVRAGRQLPDQSVSPVAYVGIVADVGKRPATIGEVNPPFQLPQPDDTVLGLAVTGAPAQRVARVGGIGDQAATDHDGNDMLD